jgi:hypothetical protein
LRRGGTASSITRGRRHQTLEHLFETPAGGRPVEQGPECG